MAIDDYIRDEKLQDDINREAAKNAFKKQITAIEDQGEKQLKAIRDQERVKAIKKYASNDEDSPWILKQKEIFNELADKRLNETN